MSVRGTQTVYASIGNSDDRLTQARWCELFRKFIALIRAHSTAVYGEWVSPSAGPWQNACAGFEVARGEADTLRRLLGSLAAEYAQDAIAWAEVSATHFLTGES